MKRPERVRDARSQVWGNWRSGPWSALYWSPEQRAWVLETSDLRKGEMVIGASRRWWEPIQRRRVLVFQWRWAAKVSRRLWWAQRGRMNWDGEMVVPPPLLRGRRPAWWGRHRFGEQG